MRAPPELTRTSQGPPRRGAGGALPPFPAARTGRVRRCECSRSAAPHCPHAPRRRRGADRHAARSGARGACGRRAGDAARRGGVVPRGPRVGARRTRADVWPHSRASGRPAAERHPCLPLRPGRPRMRALRPRRAGEASAGEGGSFADSGRAGQAGFAGAFGRAGHDVPLQRASALRAAVARAPRGTRGKRPPLRERRSFNLARHERPLFNLARRECSCRGTRWARGPRGGALHLLF